MGLPLDRRDDALHTVLTIEFPRTAADEIEGVTAMEIDEGFARPPTPNRWPAATCWWCRRAATCACRSATRCAAWA